MFERDAQEHLNAFTNGVACSPDECRQLHESGARLDAPDGAGVTPAQLAEREGNTAAAQLLRSASVPGE